MSPMEQRQAALRAANKVRFANSQTLKELSSKPFLEALDDLAAILRSPTIASDPAGGLPIRRLLIAPKRFGEGKAQTLLRTAGVMTGDRKVRQLTVRQRGVLADALEHPERLWPHRVPARDSVPR